MSEKREMTALEFLKEWKRMCAFYRGKELHCGDCPIDKKRGCWYCGKWILEDAPAEEAIALIQKWSEEHPVKTMLQDLKEKYPKAVMKLNGIPKFCPCELGYENENASVLCQVKFGSDCVACWNRPLEVEP